jgi:UDP-glucose:(heptosyl)LPS alpha-1,3-glucosyltransferase
MKIAIVSPEVGTGAGVPHYCREMARSLSTPHEVHVFASAIQREGLEGVQCHILPAWRGGLTIWHACFFVMANVRFAWNRLFERPFDLVIGIGGLTPFANVATSHFVHDSAEEQQRAHGYPPEQSFGLLARLDFAIYSFLLTWLGRRYYRDTSARIVAISQAVKRDLERFEELPQDTAVVIPNGVNIERFHPRNRERFRTAMRSQLGLAEHEVAVLFAGNAWGRKGLRAAIEALDGEGLDAVRLVVVGEGDPSAFLEGVRPNVARRIVFAGAQPREIERYYAAADVFLLPTLYEPFGLVILEALASGLPTIVSQRAGASEWLTDGVDAILLKDPADASEVRAALRVLLEDDQMAASLGLSGRLLAEGFAWERIAQQLVAIVTVPSPPAIPAVKLSPE